MKRATVSADDRFWAKVQKSNDGCWLWTAYIGTWGYGRFMLNGKAEKAHRVAWSLVYGPIPIGQLILHRCDTPACVRPEHLFLGSNKDNYDDMEAKGRKGVGVHFSNGEEHCNARLTDSSVGHLREMYAGGDYTYEQLSAIFGIHPSTVASAIRRITWRHVK